MCSPAHRANPRQGAAERRYPRAESRTQVAVNTEGKTNEATKQGKEPLKQRAAEAYRQAEREAGQGARQEPESGQAQEVQRNENVVPTLKK